MFRDEVLGYERLKKLADQLYAPGEDAAAVTMDRSPYAFVREGDRYEVHLDLPFAEKGEISLFKKEDELVVELGTIRAARWPADQHDRSRSRQGSTRRA